MEGGVGSLVGVDTAFTVTLLRDVPGLTDASARLPAFGSSACACMVFTVWRLAKPT